MISDDDLFSLAIFLGSVAMLLIVLYHFLEINAKTEAEPSPDSTTDTAASKKIPVGADPVAFTPGAAVASKVKPR
ncbi:Oligosaccaryltransferase-domain-containing protein [Talaromyces proteolyticus]|uniref:Dolichyl-diphosphooligosaccharide--protein glycosyltransferase subunit 4 n=1 Tax=Talaromyces proteolyticus TaxID=1131652 RepID=A0AAD4KSK0_9EURO|nr:Oligosaccaryltransferase-domain-containing protein [Talaromyces proteolyticus]KAH8700138.1 Oligosaccaryltransferase-domain-containing protein [Talaromyces proteolyticus]